MPGLLMPLSKLLFSFHASAAGGDMAEMLWLLGFIYAATYVTFQLLGPAITKCIKELLSMQKHKML